MGSILSTSVKQTTNPIVEKLMFPAPTPSYGKFHAKLQFVGSGKNKVACMFNIINNKRLVILYAHGNGTDIGYIDNFLARLAEEADINIISYDYEGYGLTKPSDGGLSDGRPSEIGAIRSTEIVYDYLINHSPMKYTASDIILYGTSIGTGPVVDLATKLADAGIHVRGILLQTPYTSIFGVVSESLETSCYYSCNQESNPNMFRTHEKIGKIMSKIIIVHGLKDEVIAYSNAERLRDACKLGCATLVTIPSATHNNIERNHFNVLLKCITQLIYSSK